MPYDPTIALKVSPPQFDVGTAMQNALALRNAQQTGQLNQLKLQQEQQAMQEAAGLQNYLAQNPDLSSEEAQNRLVSQYGQKGIDILNTRQELANRRRQGQIYQQEYDENHHKEVNRAISDISKYENKADALAGIERNYEEGKLDDAAYNSVKSMVQSEPLWARSQSKILQSLLSEKERLEMAAPKTSIGKLQSDYDAAVQRGDKVAAAKIKQAIDVEAGGMTEYQRAQNKMAQDRFEAEKEKGNYSPETIDYLAEIYNQTGTLPTLGLGASGVKMQILNRAREIGTAGGASIGEAATSVVQAKQTKAAEQSTLKGFTSGVEARRVTANNTAINHLETMDKLVNDLANSDIRVVNKAANAFAKETGSAAPTNFDAAKQIVAAEVIKAVVQNGGGVTERQEAAEQFARANSPAQLKGVINTYKDLLGGQLQSLKQQYEFGTKRKDFDQRLTPNTRKLLTPAAGGADEGWSDL